MAKLFSQPTYQALDANGDAISGARLFFYLTGTSTKHDTYTDNALSVAHANPVVADSAGRFAPIYLQDADYKVVLAIAGADDPPTTPIQTIDPVHGAVGVGTATLFNIKTYGAVGDGATDDAAKIQAAENAADSVRGTVVVPTTGDSFIIDARLTLSDWVSLLGNGLGSFLEFTGAATSGHLALASNHLIQALRMTFPDSQGLFSNTGSSDLKILACTFEGDSIHIQTNSTGVNRLIILQNIYKDPDYGTLINSNTTGRSIIWGDAIVEDANNDAFAINDKDRTMPGIIATRALLDCDPAGVGADGGFIMSVAGGYRVILGDIVARQTRQEAIHIEDSTEALIMRDMILDECDEDGVRILNRQFVTFDANTDVALTPTNEITITGHELMGDQPINYEIGAGTAIGGLADEGDYYAIVVDANTIQVAATPGGAAITLSTKPASETHTFETFTRGIISHDMWLRQKDEARTDTGFNLIDDSNKSVKDQLITNIYSRGFSNGFDFGVGGTIFARNLIADNATQGIQLTDRSHQMSNVGDVMVKDCATGIRVNAAKIGHVTFHGDITTLWNDSGPAGQGSTIKGHAGKVLWNHGGTGLENVTLFPAGANDRIKGTLRAHAMVKGGSADNILLIGEIKWDGATLTIIDNVSRVTGVTGSPTYQVVTGNLELRADVSAARTFEVFWDFDGYHYVE